VTALWSAILCRLPVKRVRMSPTNWLQGLWPRDDCSTGERSEGAQGRRFRTEAQKSLVYTTGKIATIHG